MLTFHFPGLELATNLRKDQVNLVNERSCRLERGEEKQRKAKRDRQYPQGVPNTAAIASARSISVDCGEVGTRNNDCNGPRLA